MTKVGQSIKKIREFKNLSRQFVADTIDVTLKTYSNIENNSKSPNIETLVKIANVLDISLIKILNFDDKAFFSNQVFHNENAINNISQYSLKEIDFYANLVKNNENLVQNQNKIIAFLKQELERKNCLIEILLSQK